MINMMQEERDRLANGPGIALRKTYCGIDKSFSSTPLPALERSPLTSTPETGLRDLRHAVDLFEMLVNKIHKVSFV